MTIFLRLRKADDTVALPAGKTMGDYADKPNRSRMNFHSLVAGFHRRQAEQLDEKDPQSAKYHRLAAHAHEGAKYAHAECLPSAEGKSKEAAVASEQALSEDARGVKKPKK
jgi:hypothetical protein